MHPSQSPRLLVNDTAVTTGVDVAGLGVIGHPDRLPHEELTPSCSQSSSSEGTRNSSSCLTSPESLHHEPIECVAKRAEACLQRQNPTIHRAVLVANIPRRLCSELEDEEDLAVPAEDLGALIFVCISVMDLVRLLLHNDPARGYCSLTHGAPAREPFEVPPDHLESIHSLE